MLTFKHPVYLGSSHETLDEFGFECQRVQVSVCISGFSGDAHRSDLKCRPTSTTRVCSNQKDTWRVSSICAGLCLDSHCRFFSFQIWRAADPGGVLQPNGRSFISALQFNRARFKAGNVTIRKKTRLLCAGQ